MVTSSKLKKDDDSTNANQTRCRSMIKGLQYLIHNRPNISNVVEIISRFQVEPKET